MFQVQSTAQILKFLELDHGFFSLSYSGVFAEMERDTLCSGAPNVADSTTHAPESVGATQNVPS